MNTMPMPTPVASIPTDRISATGISFPMPPNTQAKPANGIHGSVPVAPCPVTMAPTGQYCMPANQGGTFTDVSTNGKVSNNVED
jgi:hypothetical protein